MTTAEMIRHAQSVIPPAEGATPIATVDHAPGRRLPSGAPAGQGGRTTYRAAWLIGGVARSAPFGPAFDRPRDLGRFLGLLTGGRG